MTTVNFYLKDTSTKDETLIYLVCYLNGRRFKFSTSEKVIPKHWNPETQTARKSLSGSASLNSHLHFLRREVERICREAVQSGKPVNPDRLREELLRVSQKDTQQAKGFFDYLDEYYTVKTGKLSYNYLKKVITLKNNLSKFQAEKKYKISFDSLDLHFYDLFTSYLQHNRRMLNNSIGSSISILKTFLGWATKRGYNTNATFKDRDFKAIQSENEIIYLTEAELMNLFELDLSDNKRLEGVRESFCFSCFTGLRYSDVSKVRANSVNNGELKIVAGKTKDKLTIPLSDFAKDILKRNNFKLPVISNQKTNEYLKELCKVAEITEPVSVTKFRGVERIEIDSPKYEFITTHTGRRTFVTLSLEKGMRAETVMEITGHKNYKMFKKYIRITDGIKRMEMKKVWSRDSQIKTKSI